MPSRSPYYLYSFLVCGPGKKRTEYGLLWEGRDDRKARAHVKAWANGYHGKPNRVLFRKTEVMYGDPQVVRSRTWTP